MNNWRKLLHDKLCNFYSHFPTIMTKNVGLLTFKMTFSNISFGYLVGHLDMRLAQHKVT